MLLDMVIFDLIICVFDFAKGNEQRNGKQQVCIVVTFYYGRISDWKSCCSYELELFFGG